MHIPGLESCIPRTTLSGILLTDTDRIIGLTQGIIGVQY